MKLRMSSSNSLLNSKYLFLDKPHSWNTHSPDALNSHKQGLFEWTQLQLQSSLNLEIENKSIPDLTQLPKLMIHHRLDRETSGAILFSFDSEFSKKIDEGFRNKTIQKTYYFISDRELPPNLNTDTEIEHSSEILEFKSKWQSQQPQDAIKLNSTTLFKKIKSFKKFHLWMAKPITGKTHQIRLHAKDLKIPILGDSEYGGSSFPRLMLHSAKIESQELGFSYESEPPVIFTKLEYLENKTLCEWICAAERRFFWLKNLKKLNPNAIQSTNCIRWLHTESKNLRAEQLSNQIIFGWYAENKPSTQELDHFHIFKKLLTSFVLSIFDQYQNMEYTLHLRADRGRSPNDLGIIEQSPKFQVRWLAQENKTNFEMRFDSGLSCGLFLDQRSNRNWVEAQSKNKKVLNLFCYTSGFSVRAAIGGASQVTSVDISKNFLDWSRENFLQNKLDPQNFEFRKMDSLSFLDWANKKQFQYDLIICDPPSFARTEKGIFKIEKSLESLIISLNQVLSASGEILFCSNYETWSKEKFFVELQGICRKLKLNCQEFYLLREDFEMPHQEPIMKSFLIKKHTTKV